MPGMIEAMEYLQKGNLGEVKLARGLCYKNAIRSARAALTTSRPVDYSLWLGPAPDAPSRGGSSTMTGIGNGRTATATWEIRASIKWTLPAGDWEQGLSKRVVSYGGRFGYKDAGETRRTRKL